jgi:hypothetical protein
VLLLDTRSPGIRVQHLLTVILMVVLAAIAQINDKELRLKVKLKLPNSRGAVARYES